MADNHVLPQAKFDVEDTVELDSPVNVDEAHLQHVTAESGQQEERMLEKEFVLLARSIVSNDVDPTVTPVILDKANRQLVISNVGRQGSRNSEES
ncbi:hypothetical protein E2562_024426 [Oryza meyeriana var. granulata]|uniref:Uncharacterized protein n=1 Tax=Oryza meyeriana var. granulata TaxID=110450 RepID=A0A6G1EYM4_9ORYZ|nr:hypothetical protein E2562_024426 [Oryza meyeriana var. granulata]